MRDLLVHEEKRSTLLNGQLSLLDSPEPIVGYLEGPSRWLFTWEMIYIRRKG